MVRRRAALIAPSVLLLPLAGCSDQPGWSYSTQEDFERAAAVWRDPWVAPGDPGVPEAGYGAAPGNVVRTAGRRTTHYDEGSTGVVARAEARAATEGGWAIVAASCSEDTTSLVLTKGSGLDGAAATLDVTGRSGEVEVEVEAAVPHHSDGSWPQLGEPVALTDTCLGSGGSQTLPEVPLTGGPFPGPDGANTPEVDVPEWQRGELTGDEEALTEAVEADPWVASLGTTISTPELEARDVRRGSPGARGAIRVVAREPRRALAEVTDSMTGWEITWVSCGSGRSPEATGLLETAEGPAVVRLVASSRDVAWELQLPVPEAPAPFWLEDVPTLAYSRCLSLAAVTGLTVEGVPAVLPSGLQPVSD